MSSSRIPKCMRVSFIVIAAVAFAASAVTFMDGDTTTLSQPDGSEVTVVLFGDQYHMDAESVDGYTLVRDKDGWICYADLSPDGKEYVSTGVRYTGVNKNGLSKSKSPVARKKLRINEKSVNEKRKKSKQTLGIDEEADARRFNEKVERLERRYDRKQARAEAAERGGALPAPDDDEEEFQPAPRTVKGVALFISFPDHPAPDDGGRFLRHADSVYNSPAYTRGSGAGSGSVYNYFQDVSNGQLDYTNYVSIWVQAPKPFTYYDSSCNYCRVSELISSAFDTLNANTAEVAKITDADISMTGSGTSAAAVSLNIHPIRSGRNWAQGIWSHQGTYSGGRRVGNIRFGRYQFSGLGSNGTVSSNTTLGTGTIIHENGHMLFSWPDLYSYNSGRTFVNAFCTMASGTVMPNPFFRDLEGWIKTHDLSDEAGNSVNGICTHGANSHTAYTFRRVGITGSNANRERYYIESRFSNGRSSGIPGAGLIVWHVHTGGNNADYDPNSTTAARRTPRVAIMQANQTTAAWQSASGSGAPGSSSPYNNTRNRFDSTTAPRARWHSADGAVGSIWTGPNNDLRISEVSAAPTASNPSMTFRIGSGSDATITINDATTPVRPAPHTAQTSSHKAAIRVLAGAVSCNIVKTEAVSVKVYDIRGRAVATLVDGVMSPGQYNMNIPKKVSRGLYIVKMQSGGVSQSVMLRHVR